MMRKQHRSINFIAERHNIRLRIKISLKKIQEFLKIPFSGIKKYSKIGTFYGVTITLK